jgi:hypothetical protein
MKQDQRDQLGIKLTQIAMMYGKDFPKEQARIYIDSLVSFMPDTFENYMMALMKYLNDSKNKFFPTPMNLRQYLQPELSPDAMSNEVASRIRSAITKFGWPNPKDAREYIGDLGWKVVERSGGWQYLCENHGVDLNVLTFHAQARDLTRSLIESNELGTYDQPIGIEQTHKPAIDNLITGLIKRIEDVK